MSLELVIAAAAIAFVALLAVLWSRWPNWFKAMLIVSVTVFYFAADALTHRMWGWPADDPLPARWVLLAAVIQEPTNRDPGSLFLWVNALEDGKPAAEPRAHRLPYSKNLHVLVDEGIKKARQGITQMGSAEPKPGQAGFSWLRPGGEQQEIKISDLPAPQLPEK